MPHLSFIFAWYDFWVGFFWDEKKRKLYILPMPCVGIVLTFAQVDWDEHEARERRRFRNRQISRGLHLVPIFGLWGWSWVHLRMFGEHWPCVSSRWWGVNVWYHVVSVLVAIWFLSHLLK